MSSRDKHNAPLLSCHNPPHYLFLVQHLLLELLDELALLVDLIVLLEQGGADGMKEWPFGVEGETGSE